MFKAFSWNLEGDVQLQLKTLRLRIVVILESTNIDRQRFIMKYLKPDFKLSFSGLKI